MKHWQRVTKFDPAAAASADLHPIVQQIKQRRIALGLTQTAVAKTAGVSKTAVCQIESGLHKPGIETLAAMARGVGLILSLGTEPQRHQPVTVCRACGQPWPCVGAGDLP